MVFGMVFLIWLGCGIAAIVVAEGKGRSGCGGLLLGFGLGPLGLGLALLLGPDTAALERRALGRGGLRRCPHCAEAVQPAARRCKHCGADFTEAEMPPPGAAETPAREWGPSETSAETLLLVGAVAVVAVLVVVLAL